MEDKNLKLNSEKKQIETYFDIDLYDEKTNTAKFIITMEEKDRTGDVVKISGIDIENYKKNPVVLYNHQSSGDSYPIGKCLNLEFKTIAGSKSLIAEVQFAKNDEGANKVVNLLKQGILRAVSIGFMGIDGDYKDLNGERVFFYTKTELLEFSICIIPCNPYALGLEKKELERKTLIEYLDLIDKFNREEFKKANILRNQRKAVKDFIINKLDK